jgi:DNA-binding CsgD family transcriptional regulator
MRETMAYATGQAVFVPGEWRSLASGLGLSPRECGIVRAVFDGDTEKRTAERLGLSPHTVHTYLWRIYRKLRVQSREELLVRVFAEFRALPKKSHTGRKRPESQARAL